MKRIVTVLLVAATGLSGALAQQPPQPQYRRSLNPMAIFGTWLGTQGAMPADCTADGYRVEFGSYDARVFTMVVQPKVNGQLGEATVTNMTAVPPVEGTPLRIDIFLKGETSELGIVVLTGSKMELVPPGADRSYSQTSLYLMRCK